MPGGCAAIPFSIFFFSPRRPQQHELRKGMSSVQSCTRFIQEAPVVAVVSDCQIHSVRLYLKNKLSGLDMDPLMDTRAHIHTHLHTQILKGTHEHTQKLACSHMRNSHTNTCAWAYTDASTPYTFSLMHHAQHKHKQVQVCTHTHTRRVTSTQISTCTRTRLHAHTYQIWFGNPSLSSSALSFQDGILG